MSAKRVSARQRQQVISRAKGFCEYCRCPDSFSSDPFSIDHIRPRARGGKTILRNLAYACQGCNGKKLVKTEAVDPFTGKVITLFNPRRQQWTKHFGWNEDFTWIIGLTPCGRTTVDALDLNRKGIVNLRRLLKKAGYHPPDAL
jgi:hypothetical protein